MNEERLKVIINNLKSKGYTYAEVFHEISNMKIFEYDEEILEFLDCLDYPCTNKDLKRLGIEY